MIAHLCALLVLNGVPSAPAAAVRPRVDRAAMEEAMNSGEAWPALPSAAGYAHFLKSRLAHHEGDEPAALDELRLAQASDPARSYLLTALALEHARRGDLGRAQAELAEVLARSPDDALAQRSMGRVLLEGRQLRRAKRHLDRALLLEPGSLDTAVALVVLALAEGRGEGAIELADRWGRGFAPEGNGVKRLGLALAERGEAAAAARLLAKAVERDRGDLDSWVALARIDQATLQYAPALAAWTEAARLAPENPEVLLAAGRVALALGRRAEGQLWLDRLLAVTPEPQVRAEVAFAYLDAGQPERGVELVDAPAAGRLGVAAASLPFYRGWVRERLRRYREAVASYEAVGEEAGELHARARLRRAVCLSLLGDHSAALEGFAQLALERPRLVDLEPALSRSLERAGRVGEAESRLVAAFETAPTAELGAALIGFFTRRGHPAEAVRRLRTSLAAHPGDEGLRFALAVAVEKEGDWRSAMAELAGLIDRSSAAENLAAYALAERGQQLDRALRLANQALEARPHEVAFLDSAAWVWFKRGDTRRAEAYLRRATEVAPDAPTPNEHLGVILLKLGRQREAEASFRRAKVALLEDPDAAERQGQLEDIEGRLKLLSPRASSR